MTPLHRAPIATWAVGLALFIATTTFCSPLATLHGQTELQEKFSTALGDWKQSAKDAVIALENFRYCDADEAETYRQNWIQAVEKGRDSFHSLVDTGLKRIEAESPPDVEVLSFLVLVLKWRYDIGDYEEAYEVGRVTLATVPDAAGLLVRHIFSAFATNRFDECQLSLQKLVQLTGGIPPELGSIVSAIDGLVEAWNHETELRTAESKADDLPRVELQIQEYETTHRIVLELFENEAPNTVANFISLVEQGFYDGRSFFRVATHFDATSGCPTDDGAGNPGYFIRSEAAQPGARQHFRGSLAMVSSDQTGQAGSQFYLMFSPIPVLNGRATVFGRIVEGLDVLDRMTRTHFVDDSNQKLQQIPGITPAKIEFARVLRKRNHGYRPEKITE